VPQFVVGIGASAGGLEAIEHFFDHVPDDSGLTFVIVQHLSPDFKSLMDELLARHTKLPIHRVEDGMAIQPNAIYLIPRKKNMVLSFGKLLLTDHDQKSGLNLPIDLFFQSLAQDMGDRAIGVILSGTGSDGSRGLKEIHEAGGLVVVQDPDTASFDGMPKSALATGVADLVLPPSAMPAKLAQYAQHPVRADIRKSWLDFQSGNELSAVFALLRRHFGVDFSLYKPSTLGRRMERRMTLKNVESLGDYLVRLEADSDELDHLYRDLLVEVTQFFRDKEAFEVLKNEVIPKLFEQASAEDGLRIWAPGCATGEEAYSLAILFHDYADKQKRNVDIKIFATDVHRTSLEFAGAGIYRETSVANLPRPYLDRYFVHKRNQYAVNQELRKLVIFAPHNLTKDPPFTKLDLIVCRNVLIYLNPPTQRKILTLFHFGLRTGGVLFLGPSETVSELEEEFDVVERHWKIFRKRRDIRLHPGTGLATMPLSETAMLFRHQMANQGKSDAHFPDVYESLLARYVPPSLLLNERHELVHSFGDARKYLQVPEGKATTDLLKMLDNQLRIAVSSALHQATKSLTPVVYSGVRTKLWDENLLLKVTVLPFPNKRTQGNFYQVCLEEEETAAAPAEPLQQFDMQGESAERITGLERELMYTKEHLQSTIEELETSNEELQSTNEELVASNEELQSTNEELHSVNEELYTVNAEHQRKIDELTQLTSDMDNLLASTDIGTIFLDMDLNIRKFTPAIGRIFNLLPQDVGRPLKHISHNLEMDNVKLAELIDRMHDEGNAIELEAAGPQNRSLLVRALPYRSQNGQSVGAVLTFVDITAVKRAKQELGASQRRLDVALDLGNIGTWEWDIARNVIVLGHRLAKILNLDGCESSTTFSQFADWVHPDDRERFKAAVGSALDQDTPFVVEYRVVPAPGAEHALITRADVFRDEDGKPTRMVGVCIDVSSRKQMENALRESEQRFQAVLDNSAAIIFIMDREGRYTFANRRFSLMLKREPDAIRNRTDFDLFSEPQARARRDLDRRVLQGEAVVECEEVFPIDNAEHTFLSIRFPLRDARNGIYAIAGISTDITDRKRAENEARESLTRRDQFLAMLSHELRNPLGAILNATQVLGRLEAAPAIQQEARLVVERQVGQMARLLDDLLDVTRIAQNRIRLQKTALDLQAIAVEAIQAVNSKCQASRVHLVADLGNEPAPVVGDAARLQQMLVNLLTNAAKYTPAEGKIWLKLDREGDRFAIHIKDTGVGIRPEMIDKVFDLFVQANETLDRADGGMGVGLTLVRTIAEMHGGSVEAFSEGAGKGSEFVVRLPRSDETALNSPAPSTAPTAAATILIIEDNADSRRMLEAMLKLDGFTVHSAADGQEGLEAIRKLRPDVAIVDIGLPGLDGYQVAKRVREDSSFNNVVLIALTGYGRPDDRRAVQEAGFDEHLIKPLNPDDLSRVLKKTQRSSNF
jgi:two-component system, chemotaxis family, CheB/CheR fusion protein